MGRKFKKKIFFFKIFMHVFQKSFRSFFMLPSHRHINCESAIRTSEKCEFPRSANRTFALPYPYMRAGFWVTPVNRTLAPSHYPTRTCELSPGSFPRSANRTFALPYPYMRAGLGVRPFALLHFRTTQPIHASRMGCASWMCENRTFRTFALPNLKCDCAK